MFVFAARNRNSRSEVVARFDALVRFASLRFGRLFGTEVTPQMGCVPRQRVPAWRCDFVRGLAERPGCVDAFGPGGVFVGAESSVGDGGHELGKVLLCLVGVGLGERGDRLVEGLA
jgi:hypothetical protein